MLGRESRVDWLVEIGDTARGRFGAKRAFRGQAETKRPRMRTVLIAVLCACVPWGALHAQSLEGQWTVLQVCEATQEGARGYTWRYSARVVDGHFVGQFREKGQSPSMTLEGRIKADGTASLSARGISGSAEFNQKFATTATPISFEVIAKFAGTTGTGERVGSRACNFTFTKGG